MKKGFTLIELLAVIVILALIALITIPAVLRITENAKISSYRRSIDLYGRAINTAVMAYKSDMVEKKQTIDVSFENVIPYVDYEGYDITCTSKIYSDDTVLLTKCSIENDIVYAEKGKGFGSENYYYYTNSKKRIKALLYVEAVNNAIKGKDVGTICEVTSEGNIRCNNQTIEIMGELGNPKSGTLYIENNQVTSYSNLKFEDEKAQTQQEVAQVVDEQQINTNPNNDNNNNQNNNDNNQNNNENNNNQNNNNNTNNQTNLTNTTDNYIGYYADVDGDGNVDGVIYADLAHPSRTGASWKSNSYSYEAEDDLKEYTVSETNSPITTFGTNKIITLKPGSTGNSRFYVMALNDFREGAYQDKYYYWYKNAYDTSTGTGKMYSSDTSVNFGTGYDNTGKMIRIWNNNGESEGWTTGATQYEYDIWGKIQEKYQEGWYIPSKGEWAAFADYLANRLENPLTTSNYKTIYGLSSWYWSSSQYYAFSAWYIHFYYGNVSSCTVGSTTYVRLGVTF